MHCKVWISALCSFFLSLSPQHYVSAFQPWDSKPWLSLYTPPQRLRHPEGVGSLEDTLEDASKDTFGGTSEEAKDTQDDFLPWYLQEEEENGQERVQDNLHDVQQTLPKEYESTRAKRVFLSRGWMAGGYKAPDPSPNRFVRRPPALVQMPASFPQLKPGDLQGNEAHYEALVSDQPQQSPPYRRFHSIFTSGMWTPLGKRSHGGDPAQRPVFFYV